MPDANCGFDGRTQSPAEAPKLLVVLGPSLTVDIGFDPTFDPAKTGTHPTPQLKAVRALVDTGATSSCIDADVAAALNLPIIDRRQIAGVGGVHEVNFHVGQIYVPELDHTLYGLFAGVALSAGGQFHVALIGRDFLQHMTMNYDGLTGRVTITRQSPTTAG